jgi:transposase-like protein
MDAPFSQQMTLQQAVAFFSEYENCHRFMVWLRWPDGKVLCPRCGSDRVVYLANQRKWKCYAKHEKPTFTLKTGTVFEDSPIGLDKWIVATWQIVNCKNGISSWELHRALGVTQKTAWFMLHRVRLAMQDDQTGGKLGEDGSEVEIDETFIGGKVRNMHKRRKEKVQAEGGRTEGNKVIALGMLERNGRVRTAVIPDRKKKNVAPHVIGNIAQGATINTDEYSKGWYHDQQFVHNVVNHAEEYVTGNVHTNGIENFWSLLKRGLGGTYVSVEPFHLFRYLDEQCFRFNTRKMPDGSVMSDYHRFMLALAQIVNKRLTYAQLTGKVEERPAEAF